MEIFLEFVNILQPLTISEFSTSEDTSNVNVFVTHGIGALCHGRCRNKPNVKIVPTLNESIIQAYTSHLC